MYGPPHLAGPPPAPAPSAGGRPVTAVVGIATMFVAIAACLAETAFEVLLTKSFTNFANQYDGGDAVADPLQPWLITTVVLNGLVAIGLGIGCALMMRGANAGRVVNWVVGAVCIVVRLCCLSGLIGFGAVISAMSSDPTMQNIDADQMAPGWQIAGAATCSSIALVAAAAAMIVSGMPSVNAWFRARKAANRQQAGYSYGPYQRY